MHKTLLLLTALTGIAAGAPIIGHAAPTEHPGVVYRTSDPSVQQVDYYWNHHRWHHRDWDRDHHRWHYYD
jgi:hypothetical protein